MSARAALVAEVLWELKRTDKVATYSSIAEQAGFSAGTSGRSMLTCLNTIRREWDHLQWWRAIPDCGTLNTNGDLAKELQQWGATLGEPDARGIAPLTISEDRIMIWVNEPSRKVAVDATEQDDEASVEG